MKHLAYTHSPVHSLAGSWLNVIRGMLPKSLQPSPAGATRIGCRRRILSAAGILLALVIQAGMLWLLAELVDVAHGVMELWLELANQQLDLISLYNSVRPK